MPRFHFEIIDGFQIKDPVGMECTEAQARDVARNIARNIAIDVGVHAARKVVVVDDDGSTLHEVPIVDAQ
jgi:hypothetical protein